MARIMLHGPVDQLLSAMVVTDLLWSHARLDDHIEHIRVTSGPGWAKVVVFTPAADRTVLTDFIRRALNDSPSLAGWRVE
jgi:hypothetical protein